jgi:hypothetical protein
VNRLRTAWRTQPYTEFHPQFAYLQSFEAEESVTLDVIPSGV